MKQKLLVILCVFFAVQMAAWAQEKSGYCGDPAVNEGMDVKWELSEDGVLTISGVGAMADYDGNSPWKDYNIEKVEIAEGVTSIGGYAFCKCYELISVTIPNSVASIGNYVFYDCYKLTSITIPNSVTSIGYCAFMYCSGLTNFTIPNSVVSIGREAFSGCSGLTSITIPNTVMNIGSRTFYRCSGLTSITIPNSVASIGISAFQECSGLTSITIPNSVTSIGSRAFSWCFSLLTITCLNPVPPTLGLDAFTEISYDPILRVPDVEAYKASDWAEYFSIFEQIDPTVISDIEVDREAPTTIYDLSGRRVTEPVKGRIYIVDGKTVVW